MFDVVGFSPDGTMLCGVEIDETDGSTTIIVREHDNDAVWSTPGRSPAWILQDVLTFVRDDCRYEWRVREDEEPFDTRDVVPASSVLVASSGTWGTIDGNGRVQWMHSYLGEADGLGASHGRLVLCHGHRVAAYEGLIRAWEYYTSPTDVLVSAHACDGDVVAIRDDYAAMVATRDGNGWWMMVDGGRDYTNPYVSAHVCRPHAGWAPWVVGTRVEPNVSPFVTVTPAKWSTDYIVVDDMCVARDVVVAKDGVISVAGYTKDGAVIVRHVQVPCV